MSWPLKSLETFHKINYTVFNGDFESFTFSPEQLMPSQMLKFVMHSTDFQKNYLNQTSKTTMHLAALWKKLF